MVYVPILKLPCMASSLKSASVAHVLLKEPSLFSSRMLKSSGWGRFVTVPSRFLPSDSSPLRNIGFVVATSLSVERERCIDAVSFVWFPQGFSSLQAVSDNIAATVPAIGMLIFECPISLLL